MGVDKIIGKWPGDETDKQVEAALAARACPGCAERDRRIRELESALGEVKFVLIGARADLLKVLMTLPPGPNSG